MTIEPDTKDWTWVLDRPCDECGFDSSAFPVEQIPDLIRDNTRAWSQALAAPDASVRPVPHLWSPLEYACHVRDVHDVFDRRVAMLLEQDDPTFESWDQDATALDKAYGDQVLASVEAELIEAAGAVAGRYATVSEKQWKRRGLRSNGSVFTVETLGRYHLHDVVHHLYDVRSQSFVEPEPGEGVVVRHTEFWTRMDSALGASYARAWSREQVISGLDGRTVTQALDAGESPKAVWRAVWQTLDLPPTER